jgi:hypothetical protein
LAQILADHVKYCFTKKEEIMKRLGLVLLVLVLLNGVSEAGHGKKQTKAIFSVNRGQTIKVFVDGRLINHYPQEEVKVNMLPGKRRVKVKVFNRRGRVDFVVNNRIHVSHGYTNYFSLSRNRYGDIAMKKTAQIQYAPHKPVRRHHWDYDRHNRREVACRTRY